ncbi:amidohydrolase family protein [Nocardioides sp.]|uniref:amidohydrolase family protein n=1 Tax=Nocardioides sp. TaxID=35761 RepID=UPI00286E6479|nr:amidohydrolase family protein [Nocardioides sp.]
MAADHPALAVREWWTRLELPGLVDIHTHFLPPQVTSKVRAQFDAAGPLIGRPWPLHYRDTDGELVEILRSFGLARFTALSYAHKPDMADWLNTWAAGFAARVPEALVCGTFFPEESAAAYVATRLDTVEVFKIHVQVGNFSPLDPLLDSTWGLIAEAGTPVVLHAGSGPVPAAHTGPGPVADLLARHPRLRLVIAHMGAPEYREFLELAESHERVHLDTTMAFTDFFSEMGGVFPADLLPRVRDLGLAGKVLLGSDFPNIPYPYLHQLESLEALDLGDDWLRAVCWTNGARLFGAS